MLWDSALQGINHCFDNAKYWIKSTIEFFNSNEQLQLIIRIHPAEIYWPGTYRDSVERWIKQRYGTMLPSNVKIVPPESNISSYALMSLSKLGIVANSTTGLEMALMGKPVIVTEKAHYWGRGFTSDPRNEDEYHKTLLNIMNGTGTYEIDVAMARRYFYYIFYRASLGLKCIDSNNYRRMPPDINLTDFEELMPGHDPNLDSICDGILEGSTFVR